MSFEKVKEGSTFYLIEIGIDRRSEHYPAKTLSVGAYKALVETAKEYKKDNPDAQLRITMAVEDIVED